jgi:hypothetical protein
MKARSPFYRLTSNWVVRSLFRTDAAGEIHFANEAKPMSDGEFFGSLTLIAAALIVLRIFFV